LNLEQHPLLGTLAEGMVQEDHPTASALKLLYHEDLVGILSGQPIWRVSQHHLERALGSVITKPVQRRAVEAAPAVMCIHEDMLGSHHVPALGRCPLQGVELTRDGLVPLLLVGRDSGVESDDQEP
jgi:hypothetical protein